jgi:hypothetical protein
MKDGHQTTVDLELRIEGFDLDRRFQELKFITLRIEGFDLDRRFQKSL